MGNEFSASMLHVGFLKCNQFVYCRFWVIECVLTPEMQHLLQGAGAIQLKHHFNQLYWNHLTYWKKSGSPVGKDLLLNSFNPMKTIWSHKGLYNSAGTSREITCCKSSLSQHLSWDFPSVPSPGVSTSRFGLSFAKHWQCYQPRDAAATSPKTLVMEMCFFPNKTVHYE